MDIIFKEANKGEGLKNVNTAAKEEIGYIKANFSEKENDVYRDMTNTETFLDIKDILYINFNEGEEITGVYKAC